ncbi:MAG TPA: malonyl-ACP O-methyltransferase BioC [Accumulibacter sp.]|nr:malonyl-ACP O-methyltransferase BioC [Accumulibacter sp.]HMW16822.1 malonyl-ACP O-methyltransferase BioC [Accumulibacter sp.]HMX21661.1 malonyl-ACP O-methyltransferase BioC [Accumulibacter sp.]HMY05740.1 malonyl-ACP O-methyltransferase BioC [Accumulibacter sp.]HNC17069.1 malonyl-ACP O-methyltransferase BioC [Accumulibacter sp.]
MITPLTAKQRVRDSFDRAAASYDSAASLQRQVCEDLLAGFQPTEAPGQLLDAGCGTGYGLRLLRQRWPQIRLIAVDFAPAMLQLARADADGLIAADVEALPCADCSVDAWLSSLTVQWCDAARALREAVRVLRPGGHLAVSTLGPDTFDELRQAFSVIDDYRHTLSFNGPDAIGNALRDAGFVDIDLHRQTRNIHYPDLKTLLKAIKAIGANSVGEGARGSLLGKRAWHDVQNAYERFRTPHGLPARYDVLLAYARKKP